MSSCMLQTRRRWDITSKLVADSERPPITCRQDVKNRLQHFVNEGSLPDVVGQDMEAYANLSEDEHRLVALCQESASKFEMSNLMDCRHICNKQLQNEQLYIDIDITDEQGDVETIEAKINLPWPVCLLETSSRACTMSPVSVKRETHDLRSFWIFSILLCNIPWLWILACNVVRDSSREHWLGHILRYIAVTFMKRKMKVVGKHNPYRQIWNKIALEKLLQDYLTYNGSFVESVTHYFSTIPSSDCCTCMMSEDSNLEDTLQKSHHRIIFLIRKKTRYFFPQEIPIYTQIGASFILRFIGYTNDQVYIDERRHNFRGECCTQTPCKPGEIMHYTSTNAVPTVLTVIPESIKKHWSLICYERTDIKTVAERRNDYLSQTYGSVGVRCYSHETPLMRDVPKSQFRCMFSNSDPNLDPCTRKSFARCITSACSVALCKRHFSALSESSQPVYVRGITQQTSDAASPSSEAMSDDDIYSHVRSMRNTGDSCEEPVDNDFFDAQSGITSTEDEALFSTSEGTSTSSHDSSSQASIDDLISNDPEVPNVTNTDAAACYYALVDPTNEKSSIPRHIILNLDSHVLRRTKNPIKGNISQRRFLQNIVSSEPGQSLPLINFEADIFPTIFYNQSFDGLFPGAIPQILYNSSRQNAVLGFSGIDEILRCRVKDGASLTGTDPRYVSHAFDVLINLELNTSDTRIVQSRGYEHLMGYYTHQPHESKMSFDSVDSRTRIAELAAFTKEDPQYFYTHTVSMRHHPGVCPIYLRAEELGLIDDDKDFTKARDMSIAVQLIRSSQRATKYVWEYILRSPELPCGKVRSLWYRYEWQSDPHHAGNLPHTHGLIKIEESRENAITSLERIVCSCSRLFSDKEHLFRIGLIESEEELEELKARAKRTQQHDCKACDYRCHKVIDKQGNTVCRTPLYPPSETYSFQEIKAPHSESAEELLIDLGLARRNTQTGDIIWNDQLIGGKYFYPADKNEHFIPTSSHLWALHRSQCNLLYCDRYRRSKYIAKYIAAADAKGSVFLKARTAKSAAVNEKHLPRNTELVVAVEKSHNFKQNRKEPHAASLKHQPVGRITPFTEIVFHILKLQTVCTNIQFLKIPTIPFENRSGVVTERYMGSSKYIRPVTDTFSGDMPECIRVRRALQLPEWRQHTVFQRTLFVDRSGSKISLDKITLFSLRPPELLIFGNVERFFSWFQRVSPGTSSFPAKPHDDLCRLIEAPFPKGYFVDMLGAIYLIRLACLQDCKVYVLHKLQTTQPSTLHSGGTELLNSLLIPLTSPQVEYSLLERFVVDTSKPIIVNSNITPMNQSKFLIHLALSLGEYQTELDLFLGPSIAHVFARCSLIDWDESQSIKRETVLPVLKRYVLEQLLYYPAGGTHTFDAFLVAAHAALKKGICGAGEITAIPGVLLKQLHDKATSDLLKLLHEKRISTVQASLAEVDLQYPTADQFIDASIVSPLAWSPTITASSSQSTLSTLEQNNVLRICTNYIDEYSSGAIGFTRFPVIVGGPGVGKTFLLTLLGLYGRSKGLQIIFTSLTAETSVKFGGAHIHYLLPIPIIHNKSTIDVDRLAEKTILSLGRNPLKTAYLRHIDILCIEELGLISAELIAVIDRCLRIVRKSSDPFGGICVLATMDPVQLPPIQGRPVLTSPIILTTFRLLQLKEYVRAASDMDLQRINEIGRIPNLHIFPDLIDEYCAIIDRRCVFVKTFDDIPHEILRVVGKRVAEQQAIKERDDYIRNNVPSQQQMLSIAVDIESTTEGLEWNSARRETIAILDKKCLEPSLLRLHIGMLVRLTLNDSIFRRFSQGQLAVVTKLPSQDHGPLSILVAPAGNRNLPRNGDYIRAGWHPVIITFPSVGRDVAIRQGVLGQRLQYSVKPYVAATVHRCMGNTLPSVCAQLSLLDRRHHLWLRAQIYTLFSRVRSLDNITLVGDRTETLAVIRTLLNKVQQYDEYIHIIMQNLDLNPYQSYGITLSHRSWPFIFHSVDLPETSSIGGCVYILISIRFPHVCYIGQTRSIQRRLQEHNRRQGSLSTRDPLLLPWICAGIITGFDAPNSSFHRACVERIWQRLRPASAQASEVLDLGSNVARMYTERSLVFHQFLYM